MQVTSLLENNFDIVILYIDYFGRYKLINPDMPFYPGIPNNHVTPAV
jgi:hypothetical protein